MLVDILTVLAFMAIVASSCYCSPSNVISPRSGNAAGVFVMSTEEGEMSKPAPVS
jgi:hypothetical protein